MVELQGGNLVVVTGHELSPMPQSQIVAFPSWSAVSVTLFAILCTKGPCISVEDVKVVTMVY
jgi:hypothetical protein